MQIWTTRRLSLLLALGALLFTPMLALSQTCGCPGEPEQCGCGQAICDSEGWHCPTCYSPVLIDIKGNGFSLTTAADGVWFDIAAVGVKRKISWTAASSDDGLLALDRNGNGVIDDGRELFGVATPQPASPSPNGFAALSVFDEIQQGGDGDGRIDAADAIYSRLRAWVDKNHNGISEPEELLTLDELKIVAIDLKYQEHRFVDDYGNQFRFRAKLATSKDTDVDKWAYDVFLVPDLSVAATAVVSSPSVHTRRFASRTTAPLGSHAAGYEASRQ